MTDKNYYLYDFWNDNLIGKFNGKEVLKQKLRTGETRMISIHTEENHPQFISTNRHIMQGLVDMTTLPAWQESGKRLSGKSKVVGGETYQVVIALNGYQPLICKAKNAKTKIEIVKKEPGIALLSLSAEKNEEVEWSVVFKK